ncbi:hypothetical protein BRD01_15505 [Halobacteriales archaeon QS_8_65_32]|nr:MAG: hypothetical protein BRD01_15505 [Halobacteriales archaeon QS_8_65_32]
MTGASLPSIGPNRPSRRTLLVCLVAVMTVLAGCGGGGGGNGGGAGTTAATTGTSTASGTGAGTATSTGTGTRTGTATAGDTTATDTGTAAGSGTTSAGPGTTANGTGAMEGANASGTNASGGMNASVENASLRVAHMSPDAPAVTISIDGQQVLSDVPFPEVSEYLTVPAGQHRVQVTEAGTPSNVLFNGSVMLDPRAYTLVAAGEASGSSRTDTRFGVTLLNDSTAPAGSNASVRLTHVSPDAGPVDVTVNGTDQVLFDNVTFANASDYAEVPGGNYTLSVRAATANDSGPVVDSFDVTLTNGTAYTAFAAGYVTPGRAPVGVSFEPIIVTDGLDATIRFAHMAPDAPGVDVSVSGQVADEGLAYTGVTEYFEVPAGNRTVTITAANASEPLFEGQVELNASTNYTVVAAGEASEGSDRPFEPIVLDDDEGPSNESVATARLVHAAPDVPPVAVEANGEVVFSDVDYGNVSASATVPGGNYTFDAFVATADDTGDDIESFSNVDLANGTEYTVLLAGYVTPSDEPGSAELELVVANDTDDYEDRDSLD